MKSTTSIRAINAAKNMAEAKEICRDIRQTFLAVEAKYGPDHHITKDFSDMYDNAVDEMSYLYNAGKLAA